jgi:Zn finger protein HypA/HybF involved in hydrogenase expression
MSTRRLAEDDRAEDYHLPLSVAGERGKGAYRCAECSHGVTVHRVLPLCPLCSGSSWEQSAWSPFSRATRLR